MTRYITRHISIWLLLLAAISNINCEYAATAERKPGQGKRHGAGSSYSQLQITQYRRAQSATQKQQAKPAAPSLSKIASEGRLLELRARLKVKVTERTATGAHLSLLKQTEQLIQNQKVHDQKRQKKLDATLKDMNLALANDDYEQGLAEAVIAYGLQPNIAELRKNQKFQELIRRSSDAAQKAYQKQQWLSALNLYRGLNLLYESEGTYLPSLKKVERRIRYLSMYNTAHLQKRLDAKARADGEPINVKLDDIPWDRMLKGVKVSMYMDALLAAHERHISKPSYQIMLSGAIQNLKDLVLTRSLAEKPDFSALGDTQKTNQFLATLSDIEKSLGKQRFVSYRELQGYIQQIMTANLKSVTLPFQVVVYELASGSFEELDDFSSIIWPVEVSQFNRNVQGQFFGIGVQIIRRDGRLIVVSPLPGTPASKAGIMPEDVIATVNGTSTSGWSLDKAVQSITGKEGTSVVLGIDRRGNSKLLSVPIKRAQIKIHSVLGWQIKPNGKWDMMIDRKSGVGYLRITQFVPQTVDDMDYMISDAIRNHGMKSLILDLRYNPGGLLESAIDMTNRFVKAGTIVSTVGPSGRVVRKRGAQDQGTYPAFPLIVLINEGSASASEIFCGAIRHYKRGLLIGQRTFGKGSVQDLFDLTPKKDARLKLTTHYYALPSGKIIHRLPGSRYWGVNPNLTMHIMPEVIAEQLERRQKLDILSNGKQDDLNKIPLPKGHRPADLFLKEGLDMELEMAVIAAKAILLER